VSRDTISGVWGVGGLDPPRRNDCNRNHKNGGIFHIGRNPMIFQGLDMIFDPLPIANRYLGLCCG
jgi:hypothetical protein